MIVIDTHIWVWWVGAPHELSQAQRTLLSLHESTGLVVSAISCWEVAKKAASGAMLIELPIDEWMAKAIAYPGIKIEHLSPAIVIESTRLPAGFHKDPADELIVATSRILKCTLLTSDGKIRRYPHVELAD